MKALILAGGLGTRLRPLTLTIPKPLIPIHDKPFLWYQVKLLASLGIHKIVLSTGYLGEKIQSYFNDGSDFGVHISYSHEDTPLGTGGAVHLAQNLLDSDFLLLNGDDLPILDWKAFVSHAGTNMLAIHTAKAGNVLIDTQTKRVSAYLDKNGSSQSSWSHGGVSLLTKGIFDLMTPDTHSIEEDLYRVLARQGSLYYMEGHDITLSIGTFERLEQTKENLIPYLKQYIHELN